MQCMLELEAVRNFVDKARRLLRNADIDECNFSLRLLGSDVHRSFFQFSVLEKNVEARQTEGEGL